MPKRRKRINWRRTRTILLLLLFVWLVFEGRFFIPRKIRPTEGIQPIEVELQTTSYCHCRKCCSYKWFLFLPYQKTGFLKYRFKRVGQTSSGAMVHPGTIAADTSIFPYGTIMYVPGYGYGRVEDTGGAIKGGHIDLYRPNHWYAQTWGVQMKQVKVWLPATAESRSFDPSTLLDDERTNIPAEEADATGSEREHETMSVDLINAISNDASGIHVQDEG